MLYRRPRTAGLVAAAAATTLAVVPAAAGAATSGTTTIDLKGPAAKALSAQHVRLSAQRPARASAKRIVLPVARGTVATGATLQHGGSVTFRARTRGRTRSAKLTAWQTKVGTRRSTVSAKLGRARVTLLTIAAPQRRVRVDKSAGTARLSGGTARLTPAGAKALRRALGLRRLPAAQLGSAKVSASVSPTAPARRDDDAPTNPNPGPGGGGGGGGTTPPDPTTPRAPPITREPPVLPRPTSATDITGARLTWWVRDSWITYLYGDAQAPAGTTGTSTSGGATPAVGQPMPNAQHICKDAPRPLATPLVFAFDFQFKNGWYDVASRAAGVYFSGAVRFLRVDHDIDMTGSDPEVEINGTASRTIFRFDGRGNTRLGNKRGVLTELDVANAQRTEDTTARTVTYGPILGKLGATSSDSFAGYYFPGEGYGCIQLSFSY